MEAASPRSLQFGTIVFIATLTLAALASAVRGDATDLVEKTGLWAPLHPDDATENLCHLDDAVARPAGPAQPAPADPMAEAGAAATVPPRVDPVTGERQLPTIRAYPPPTVLGRHAFVPDGVFGGALRLDGPDSALVLQIKPGNPHTDKSRTVEGWFRFEKLPAAPAGLFYCYIAKPAAPGLPAVSKESAPALLELLSDGRLHLSAAGVEFTSRDALSPARWYHLSLAWGDKARYGSRVWLRVDGKTVLEERAALVDLWRVDTCLVGNARGLKSGFQGLIDEVRESRSVRNYYPNELDWVDVGGALKRAVARPWFRDPADQIFVADFNETLRPSLAAPGTESPAWKRPDAVENLLEPGKTPPRLFVRGVEREGLLLAPETGVSPAWTGVGNLRSEAGTLAFWIRPVDWNNYTRWHEFVKHAQKMVPLLVATQDDKTVFALTLHEEVYEPVTNPIDLNPGQWLHLALTWEGKSQRAFVNGEPWPHWGSWTWTRKTWDDAQPVRIALSGGGARTVLDDLRIFRRALAPSEVANLAALHDRRRQMQPLPDMEMVLGKNGVLGRVSATITPLIEQTERIRDIVLTVAEKGAEKPLAAATCQYRGESSVRINVETGPMPFADFTVTAQARAADGAVLGTAAGGFTRVKPAWWHSRVGVSNKVLPGWDPVRADGSTVHVILRDITFAPSGLPERIVSAGKDVLAGPISFEASLGGAVVPLRAEGVEVRVPDGSEVRADSRGALAGPDFRLDAQGYTEFDGMMWFTFTLAPQPGKAPHLDRLVCRIPYAADSAEMIHWWSGEANFRDPRVIGIGAVPAEPGIVLSSADSKRLHLAKGQRGSFIPYVMLTGDERGMAWFGESDRGWTQSADVPAVQVERAADRVTITLNIVSSDIALSEPRTFAFGLHPIPVKPLVRGWRMTPGWGVFPDSFMGNNLKGDRSTQFWRHPENMDWDAVARRFNGTDETSACPAAVKSSAARFPAQFRKTYGRPPLPHENRVAALYLDLQRNGNGYPADSVDWAAQWQGVPHGGKIYDEDLVDYYVWIWNEWVRRGFAQGFYMDDCFNLPVYNDSCQVTYKLPDGAVQPGFPFLGYRDCIKRMRQVCVDNGIVPHFCAHSTHTFFIPYHSFFDVIVDGEDHYRQPPSRTDFIDCWPLARLRFMNPVKWGIVPSWLAWRGAGEIRHAEEPDWSYRQERAFTGVMMLHDLLWTKNERYSFTSLTPQALDPLRFDFDPDTVCLPYWDPKGAARCDTPDVRVTVWKRSGMGLAVIVNTGKERREPSVVFDTRAMGFGDTPPDAVAVRDIDPTLLVRFKKAAAPDAAKEAPLLKDPGESADQFIEMVKEQEAAAPEARAKDPDAKLEWKAGVLRCAVRPHDYRLLLFSAPDKQPNPRPGAE